MKLITRLLAASILTVSGTYAHAAESWLVSKVKVVYPQANGSVILSFVDNAPNCSNPTTPTKYMYIQVGQNGVTAEGLKNMLSTALVAYATGGVLSVAFDDGTSACNINRLAMAEQ
jgi:hypothetical protein